MALRMTVHTETGLLAPMAYLRVEGVTIDAAALGTMTFRVRSYVDPARYPAFQDDGFECAYTVSGRDPMEQAYLYLKTLPSFEAAQDA